MSIFTTLIGLLLAQALAAAAPAAAEKPAGYLAPGQLDTIRILPPAPTPGDVADEADRARFRASRALEGSPRWAMATADVDVMAMYTHMACAVGVELTPATAPRLTAMLVRSRSDLAQAYDPPKKLYARPRPYKRDAGAICTPRSPALDNSEDYPSGHSAYGWSVGLILAELAPDRASEILQRARAFGESRAVCGVHSASAVDAGRTAGAALVAALHGSPDFRGDLDAARAEVAAARAAGPAPDAAACQAETALTLRTPY